MPSKLVNKFLASYGTHVSLVPPQEPTNRPYPEPVEFSSHLLILCLKVYPVVLASVSTSYKWAVSFRFPHQNPAYISLLPHMCHMSSPSPPPFDHPNNIC